MRISRRTIFRSFVGILSLPLTRSTRFSSAHAASLAVEQLRRNPEPLSDQPRRPASQTSDPAFGQAVDATSYRADATILLFSIPIYKRRGAGGGRVELQQRRQQDRDTLSIRFSAGSYPAQARGLNRLGYIEEVIVSRASRVEELAYFGFMTSSPEQDVAEARRAIEQSGQTAVTYSAAEGRIRSGIETSRKSRLNLADIHDWTESAQLLDNIRTAFLGDQEAEVQTRKQQGAPATFLYSLLSAAWGREKESDAAYSYLAKDYRMHVEKKSDPEAGRRMAEEGLTNSPREVVLLKGTIQERGSDKSVKFKLWIEDNGRPQLPIRFEYKARPFLRVCFERDPAQAPETAS